MADPTTDSVTLLTVALLQRDLTDRVLRLEDQLKRIETAPAPTSALSVEVERALGLYSEGIPRDIANGMRRRVMQRRAQGENEEQLLAYIRGGEPIPDTIGG